MLPPPLSETPPVSDFEAWLWLQSAALVVALLWVGSLLRALRTKDRELATYRERNEQLSGALLRSIESASLERAKVSDQRLWLLDSTIRSFVDFLTQASANVLTSSESLAEPGEPERE